jgi:hypothetical protein
MGAIVKELKEKIVAAGGDTTGVQTVSEALDKLPAGGGSGGVFVITFTSDEDNIYQLTSDKTVREIINAAEAGMVVFGKWKYEDQYDLTMSYTYLLRSYSDTEVGFRDLILNANTNASYENLDDYLVIDIGD